MSSPDDEIGDNEILYRRISVKSGWVKNGVASPQAFSPLRHDGDGISFTRAKFHQSPASAAQGPSEMGYYVASCTAGELRAAGIAVSASPTDEDPGHAHAPGLNYADRNSDQCKAQEVKIAEEMILKIEGPFIGNPGER